LSNYQRNIHMNYSVPPHKIEKLSVP
jgi:hypothetical protein